MATYIQKEKILQLKTTTEKNYLKAKQHYFQSVAFQCHK
ncbi:MAG: hypothetical protein UW84_C0048G0005 [Candidatus Collierbacteria bacterium GW2011_GWA2_44_99]|uniref:Uncharacterized protein n=1 Tax=Candidatus Collierbacteria bacterium GW2011_GWA2_44_99 TaxID=1618380 RepID=A0A0G1KMU6_9BACT|nr:MAG: hypothetical protein UW84_C0048G0005 [Candidatus Collierbacteria bacterium GW2011_GWA2_44_99]